MTMPTGRIAFVACNHYIQFSLLWARLKKSYLPGLFITVLLSGGCSMHYSNSGKIQINSDLASVLGNEIGRFSLADGGNGVLREMGGEYSLKWGLTLTEQPLKGISWAQIKSQYTVDGHTLLLLQTATPACPEQYQLIDIRGTQLHAWNFHDVCGVTPYSQLNNGRLRIEFLKGETTYRFTWQHGEVYQQRVNHEVQAKPTQSPVKHENKKTLKSTNYKNHASKPAPEPLPDKVTQPPLDNTIPETIYEPSSTRQTSLDVNS